jgi:hypothetical protein
MKRGRILALATLSCLVLSIGILGAGTSSTGGSISVGDFAVMIASRVTPEDAAKNLTPASAAEVLKKAGVKSLPELNSPLTEAETTAIFAQFGITLQAMSPSDLMDRARAESLVGTFADTLSAKVEANERFGVPAKNDPSSSISLDAGINDCRALPKTKDCHQCCIALGFAHKVCGKSCSNNPHLSGVEPTP